MKNKGKSGDKDDGLNLNFLDDGAAAPKNSQPKPTLETIVDDEEA